MGSKVYGMVRVRGGCFDRTVWGWGAPPETFWGDWGTSVWNSGPILVDAEPGGGFLKCPNGNYWHWSSSGIPGEPWPIYGASPMRAADGWDYGWEMTDDGTHDDCPYLGFDLPAYPFWDIGAHLHMWPIGDAEIPPSWRAHRYDTEYGVGGTGNDWSATLGDYDLGCKIGWGATEGEAIADLRELLDEGRAE